MKSENTDLKTTVKIAMTLLPLPDHLVHDVLTQYLDAVSLIRLASTNHAARELYRDDVDAIRTFFLTTPCANVRAARVMGFPCWRTFVKGITALCPHRMVMIEGWYPFDDFVFLDNGAGTFPFPPCTMNSSSTDHYIHPFHPFQTRTQRDQTCLHILRTMFPHLPQRTGLRESDIASFLKVHVSLCMAGGDGNATGVMSVVRTDGNVESAFSFIDEMNDRIQTNTTHLLSVDEFQRVHPKWTQWLRQGPVGPFPSVLVNLFPDVTWIANDGRIEEIQDDSDVFNLLETDFESPSMTGVMEVFRYLSDIVKVLHDSDKGNLLPLSTFREVCGR
eukprot:PhF_6_TR37555/c2_g1_i4/m.55635